jgi:hypothetical protein
MSDGHFVKIVDTRLDTHSNQSTCYVLGEGAQNVSYVPLVANSYSNQNVNFSLNNIATNTCRDSRLEIVISFVANIPVVNTTAGALNIINADNFGFRSYPIARSCASIQQKINQSSYTLNTNDLIDALTFINAVPKNANFYDNTQPDCVDNWSNASGSNLTPLGPYTNTLQGNGVYKNRSLNYQIISGNSVPANSNGTVSIQGTLVEPLITPFNNISKDDEPGLFAINGEIISIQWVSNLFNSMFAFALPTGLTFQALSPPTCSLNGVGYTGTFTPPTLNCIYITPYESQIPKIPKQAIYHYNDYVQYNNNIASNVAPGTTVNLVSQVAQFTNVPQYILIYARPANSVRDAVAGCSVPDVYMTIENLSIQWDNGQPIFSQASSHQLYNVSERNGLCMNREQFMGKLLNASLVASGQQPIRGVGSILVVSPTLDLSARPHTTAGSPGRYVMQITQGTARNNTSQTYAKVDLYIVGITNGILERMGSEYRNYLLNINDKQLYQARMASPITRKMFMSQKFSNAFLSGGGISDFIKNLASSAYGLARKGASQGLSYLQSNPQLLQQGVGMAKKALGLGGQFKNVHPKRDMDLYYE